MTEPVRILFLCTQNACRSQIAEGLARHFGKGRIESHSAGTEPATLNPMAALVMEELDIDISQQSSKSVDELKDQPFNYVITVCDRAKEQCPTWPATTEVIHWSIDDPAEVQGDEAQRLKAFRRTRDEIRRRMQLFLLSSRIG